jgi:hypothetical protein
MIWTHGTRGQVIRMTELERAVQWLTEMERSYNLDRATGFASSKHDEAANHCKTLLNAIKNMQAQYIEDQLIINALQVCMNETHFIKKDGE